MARIPIEVIVSAKDEASSALSRLGGTVGKTARDFDNYKREIATAAGILAGIGATASATALQVLKQTAAFEQYKVALTTILGDANRAEEHFNNLKEFAKTTPFNFEEVIKNNNLLLAMGSTVEEVIDEMTMLGNVASGLNVPIERIALNFGQIRAQGKLTGRELRDFATAGVPIMEELAKILGVTKEEVLDLVSDGAVGFDTVKEAFKSMTGEGGKFFDLMQNQSKTTAGKFSNLQDTIQQVQAEIGTALQPTVNKLIETLIPLVEKIGGWIVKHKDLVLAVTATAVVMGVLGSAVLAVGAVLAVASVAVLAIVAWVGLLVGAIVLLILKWDTVKAKLAEVQESFNAFISGVSENMTSWRDDTNLKLDEMKNSITTFFQTGIDNLRLWAGLSKEEWGEALGLMSVTYSVWKEKQAEDWKAWEEDVKEKTREGMFSAWQSIEGFANSATLTFAEFWYKTEALFLALQERVPEMIKEAVINASNTITHFVNTALQTFERFRIGVERIFGNISGIISRVGDGIRNVIEAFKSGREAGLQGFASGGVVPGPIGAPQLAVVHGGEEVIPTSRGAGSGAGGASGITLNVNVGVYAGSEIEKRNLARELYSSLVRVAQSQNVSVADMMGG